MFEGETAPVKKGRSKGKKPGRKPKLVAPSTVSAEPAAVPTRKRARKARPVMISVDVMPHLAGLSHDEMTTLMAIVGGMKETPKKSRIKIVAALAKVFS
jgi:hypothetical protein